MGRESAVLPHSQLGLYGGEVLFPSRGRCLRPPGRMGRTRDPQDPEGVLDGGVSEVLG